MSPTFVAEPPPDWQAADVAPPLGRGSAASLTAWRIARTTSGDETFVTGCVTLALPGWIEEVRPAAESRMAALVVSSVARATGTLVEAQPGTRPSTLTLVPAGTVAARAEVGQARMFLGFEGHRLHSCFAACATRARAGEPSPVRPATDRPSACEAALAASELLDGTPPPPPGAFLRALAWAVHRPGKAAGAGALGAVCAAIAAVGTRRKPKTTYPARPRNRGA